MIVYCVNINIVSYYQGGLLMLQPLPRIKEYEDMGLGLFIHWGLYSLLDQGEWTEFIHELPQQEYEQLTAKFFAEKFDPQKIVKVAKNMGAKYICLTTKHHEGFFLYDTCGLSQFDALHSAAKRDLIKEFVDACNRENIKPFFYMASYDWHHPDYEKNFDNFLEYLRKSVEILCKNYGKVGGFWFDGNWNKKEANWKLDELYGTIRKYQPEAMIINNTGLKNRGKISNPEIDAVTYERHIPDTVNHGIGGQKYVAGEISLTLNQHWGVASNDIDFKSPKEVIENICHARKVGANILINIGLNGDGSIPPIDEAYMELIGKWTKLYGSAFYYGRPSLAISSTNPKDFILTTNSKTAYIFIHDLRVVGNSNVVLGGENTNPRTFFNFNSKISDLKWIDNEENLSYVQDEIKGIITLDATGYRYGCDYVVRVAKATLA